MLKARAEPKPQESNPADLRLRAAAKLRAVDQLCSNCGICCDGTLFKDVELRERDNPRRLKELGLKITTWGKNSAAKSRTPKFTQPCAVLEGCLCQIYPNRPAYCRDFECALLKAVIAGCIRVSAAHETIRKTRRRADSIRRLLLKLGDSNGDKPLSIRFRKLQRKLESAFPTPADAAANARLTRAVLSLNLALDEHFYPGSKTSKLKPRAA